MTDELGVAERVKLAEATYLALCALDPEDKPEERSEALAAGIPAERVESLYPLSLDAIALPLLEHFQRTGTSHLRGDADLNEALASVNTEFPTWPKALQQGLLVHHPSVQRYSESVWELIYFLRDQAQPAPDFVQPAVLRSKDTYYTFPVVLWNAWWIMARRESLPLQIREQAESQMAWVAEHLLPNLAGDQPST